MKRIVTENDANGKSIVMQVDQVALGDIIWESDADHPLGFEPRKADMLEFLPGGVKAINLVIPPDAVMAEYLKKGVPGLDARGFHRTGTLDFLILLDGELSLELDDGSISRLEPGDVVVQRDTNHAWRNTGEKPAHCFAIISKPFEAPDHE